MRRIKKIARSTAALGIAVIALTGCAASATPPLVQTAQAAPDHGVFTEGTIAALRSVDTNSNPGSRTGVNDVLAALQQPRLSGGISGREIVILTTNNMAATLPSPPDGLAAGDKVAITGTEGSTVVRRY
jgi:hypothetical protein